MRKIIILFAVIAHAAGLYAQIDIKSGLLLGGGRISSTYDAHAKYTWQARAEINSKLDAGIGYRFRLQPENKKFFVDLDLLAGTRIIESSYWPDYFQDYQDYFQETEISVNGSISSQSTHAYFQFSFNPTFNYNFYDGWYVGLGAEPMFYMASHTSIRNYRKKEEGIDPQKRFSGFDVPLTAKVGYDFKYMDVAFGYKYGLRDVLTPAYFYSGKVRAWQVQLFIPF
jgi:hypothetical protein